MAPRLEKFRLSREMSQELHRGSTRPAPTGPRDRWSRRARTWLLHRPRHLRPEPTILRLLRIVLSCLTLLTAATSTPLLLSPRTASAAPIVGTLDQTASIWENDDQAPAASVDSNTAQRGANTSVINVHQGERLTTRIHLTNSGTAESADVGLFYDRNDGIYTRVRAGTPAVTGNGTCADTNFDCTTIDNGNVGTYSSVAMSPSGDPWIAYRDEGNAHLKLASKVASNGSGCGTATTTWLCADIDDTGSLGRAIKLGVSPAGVPWIVYNDATNNEVKVAHYVGGSSGSGCTDASWTCELLDVNGANWFQWASSSIAFDTTGTPWISYYDAANTNLKYAQYVGSSGSGCSTSIATWTCGNVDNNTGDVGQASAIAFDATGVAHIVFQDSTNNYLRWAKYVGSGGSGCGTGVSLWTCVALDASGGVGRDNSIAVSPSGYPWAAYLDSTNGDLRVAQYVGTGGSGCGASGSSAWTCTTVDSANDVGHDTAIAFDAAGHAWVSYGDSWNQDLRYTRYVGSSGSGCASSSWTCSSIDTSGSVGYYTDLAFDSDGKPWISYQDGSNGSLKAASLHRGGEILIAAGAAGSSNGATLTKSHADMSTATDNANATDADCVTGGATWNNGKWFNSPVGAGLSLPLGTSTAQCTEVAFTIDTSQAQAATTYNFVVATADAGRLDRGRWRGPSSITNRPRLTMATTTLLRASKDSTPDSTTNCADTSWGCSTIDSSTTIDAATNVTIDSSGAAWVAYWDATNKDIRVAKYVGSGGTCSNTQWTCTQVDGSGGVDMGDTKSIALATGLDGSVWLAYPDTTNKKLRVAKYVGSSGSGCTSSAWTCTIVAGSTGTITAVSMAMDTTGSPWISYQDQNGNKLTVAHYVAANGSGCTSSAWTCTVAQNNGVGDYTSIALDPAGTPWIAFSTWGGNDLEVAKMVGVGGTNCTDSSWSCTVVDSSGDYGTGASLAFDSNGKPWISERDQTNFYVRAAHYVGSGGTGCAVSSWTCEAIYSGGGADMNTSLAFDSTGAAWMVFQETSTNVVRLAKYVGSGGTGCVVSTWTCSSIISSTAPGPALAFDLDGNPWVTYRTSNHIAVAKLHLPPNPPSYASVTSVPSRNAIRGDARLHLDSGYKPYGSCSATTDAKGYCGIASNDSDYDSVSALANEVGFMVAADKSTSNAGFPTATWIGQSNVAASTKNIMVQVYRFGSTNAWTTLSTNSTLAANTDGTITATPSAGSASEYWQSDGSSYWSYFRVYQATNGSSTQTLKTNQLTVNNPPQSPSSLAQYKSDGTTGVPATTLYSYDSSTGSTTDANGGTLSISSAVARTGGGSLKITTSAGSTWLNDGNSSTRDLSANGPTFTAWVYIPSANSGGTWFAYLSIFDPSVSNHDGPVTNIPRDTWTMISYTPSPSLVSSMTYLAIGIGGSGGGTNTIYVDDVQQGRSYWNNGTTTVLKATVSDVDASDTDAVCVEAQPVSTPFTGTNTGCGTGVAYSGSGVTASVSLSLTNGTSYHWQARTKDAAGSYSAWVSFGGNSDTTTADTDVAIDTSAPTTGTVYDGSSAGVESSYNSGSLTTLSGNWSGFSDAASGIYTYDYSIGTTAGATNVLSWTTTTSTSFTASSLSLRTNQRYYVNVRATDLAGNTSSTVSSSGQMVAPILTFTTSASSVAFANLSALDSYTDTKSITATVTTNAYSGYQVSQYASQLPTYSSSTISAWSGTWASPTTWSSGAGFGYTSSDTSVSSSNRFATGTKYAGVAVGSPGDIVADSSTIAPTGDTYTLTYKISATATQPAGRYRTTIVLSCVATY